MSEWPKWAEQASKGDLIRVTIYQRAAISRLVGAIVQLMGGDSAGARNSVTEYVKADRELGELLDQIGGKQ